MTASSPVPTITLNNGVEIPQFGFGVWEVPPADARRAVSDALAAGYRHIDTAEMYGNEQGVGEAVRESGIPRDEIFVTSKLNNGFHEPDAAMAAFERTLEALDLGHLDLFLIHWPLPGVGDFVETWKAMEEMYASGRVRAIGVSNFKPHHLRRLMDASTITPAVNQIEINPFLTNDETRAFDAEHGIATEAWSPLAQGKVFDDPVLARIARKHDRSVAQVVLRWVLQRGDIVFPRSVNPERVKENFAVFDFDLEPADMSDISALNRDERTGPDPDTFNWIPAS